MNSLPNDARRIRRPIRAGAVSCGRSFDRRPSCEFARINHARAALSWYGFRSGGQCPHGVAGCGALGPPIIALDDNAETEAVCLDVWSIVHFATGTVLADALGDDGFMPSLGLVTAWELTEPDFWPGWNESELNQRCDIAVGMLGWLAHEAAEE